MIELKAFVARKIDEGTCDPAPCVEVYRKSDVDAAIAELKEQLESEKASRYAESVDAGMHERRLRDSMEQAIRRQKYKRCLAMAEKCHAIYEKYSMLAADDANWEDEDYYFARWRFFERWRNRWLELADELKRLLTKRKNSRRRSDVLQRLPHKRNWVLPQDKSDGKEIHPLGKERVA